MDTRIALVVVTFPRRRVAQELRRRHALGLDIRKARRIGAKVLECEDRVCRRHDERVGPVRSYDERRVVTHRRGGDDIGYAQP